MAGKSYFEKLKDPRWQKRRLEVLDQNGWACEDCGETSKTLHVHHGYYESGKEPWEYDDLSLHVVCEDCHGRTTELMKRIRRQIGCLPVSSLGKLLGYIHGIALIDCPVGGVPVTSYEHAEGIGDAWRLSPEQVIDLYQSIGEPVDGFSLQDAVEVSRGQPA
jgi:hypothetical protein